MVLNQKLHFGFLTFAPPLEQCALALDGALVPKFSKRHFFQDIKKSSHGVTQMGLKPYQNFFQKFFSASMVAREVQSFCILEDTTNALIEQIQQG